MLRVAALVLTLAAAGVVFAVWWTPGPVHTLQTPEVSEAPVAVEIPEERPRGFEDDPAEDRIGNFRRPDSVPEYEVLEEEANRVDGIQAARLLVDTESRGKADYELIARDLKARYADYDAVTAEFTDTADTLDYNGGALIFNTIRGAAYMGYFFGPPNSQGYYVRAAE